MIFSVAWRNIWRNKVRSLVVIFAVAIGLYAGVWSAAFMKGMMNQRIDKVIKTELSNMQVHNPEFRKTSEFTNYMENASVLAEEISKLLGITIEEIVTECNEDEKSSIMVFPVAGKQILALNRTN